MISLFDYIIESLINSKELINDLTFKECSREDFFKTADTDEFEHGKALGFDNMNDMKESSLLIKDDKTLFYYILYKEHIIGFFSLFYLKNYIDRDVDRWVIKVLLQHLCDKDDKLNYNDFKKELLNKGVYIVNWQISQSIKKKLDINDFALVKIFYSKLEEMLKKENIKYIYAHGKDDHRKKGYVKVGKFKDYKKEYGTPDEFKRYDNENNDVVDKFVVKMI